MSTQTRKVSKLWQLFAEANIGEFRGLELTRPVVASSPTTNFHRRRWRSYVCIFCRIVVICNIIMTKPRDGFTHSHWSVGYSSELPSHLIDQNPIIYWDFYYASTKKSNTMDFSSSVNVRFLSKARLKTRAIIAISYRSARAVTRVTITQQRCGKVCTIVLACTASRRCLCIFVESRQ